MRNPALTKLIAALAAVLLLAVGCDFFDDDGDSRPSVLVEVEPSEGPAPLEVAFSALPRDDVGDGATWLWDFGDGATTTEQNPDHTYTEPGDYEVTLRLTLENGDEFTYDDFVEVLAPGDDGTSTPVEFEEWQSVINAACATSSEDAAAVPGDPTSPEALAALLEINKAETEAVESVGIPRHRRDEALDWLELRRRGSALFEDLAQNPPTTADDPRPAELQAIGQELSALSEQLGLTDCVADQ